MLKPVFLTSVCLIGLVACKEEPLPCMDPTNPICPNFDSCLVFLPANADFTVIDSITGLSCYNDVRQDLVFETDTILEGSVYFKAKHDASSYTWKISTDSTALFSTKTLHHYFDYIEQGRDIQITLISCKTPPSGCDFQSCDTVTKTIHQIPVDLYRSDWSYAIGSFIGATRFSDSFVITIPAPLPTLQGIINFPQDCDDQYLDVYVGRLGFLIYPGPTFCQSVCGVGRIQEDRNKLVIDFQTKPQPHIIIIDTWKGRRI